MGKKLELLDGFSQLGAREISTDRLKNVELPKRLFGGPEQLHSGLEKELERSGNRAIVVINRPDGTPGHVFNAENIKGQIFLFEAIDGVAVPLAGQADRVVAVQGFYALEDIASYDIIVTSR